MKPKPSAFPALPQRFSLVAQTVQSICDGIQAGHWQELLPGERELCARLQVSRSTVRAALSELQRRGWLAVSNRQRRRITSERTARLAADQKSVVAILAPLTLRTMPPAAVLVIDALREQLARTGWTIELHVNRSCFSSKPARALEKLVRDTHAAAWLLVGSSRPMQSWFLRQSLPCLVMGTCANDIALPFADADHRATCRHAGALFLRKGHHRLALVLPESTTGGDTDSERGMREALSHEPNASLLVLRHRDKAHLCMLLDNALRSPNPPTAYLVARSVHALTVAMHLLRRKVRLPQDAAVLSRDDETFLWHTSPSVSRYAIDAEYFARKVSKAVRQLAETGMLTPRAIRFIPKLIAGETV
jgi:DNA-binding LacI/PurR family transcriptional regulator